MRRQNWMSLALFALLLNSGLAYAANSITSMTPDRVQPGQVVTLHGQFSVANFRSRQYRIMVNKKIAPRPQGAINGFIEAFRVTPTSVMLRIPETWRGKPVYPGEYVLGIRDVSRKRTVFSGFSLTPLLITSGTRTALGAARKIMLAQARSSQQQGLANIRHAARPPRVRADSGSGVAQMKLIFKGLKVRNQNALSGVSIGDSVTAWFDIQNLGTTAGRVKVGYMIGNRPQFTSNGFVTVAPGKTIPMLLTVRINARNYDRNINHGSWNPIFKLLTKENKTYRDSYMADNVVARANIPLIAKEDLAVVSIEAVKLKEYWEGGTDEWDHGVTHPVSLEFLVKVRNNGSQNSRPTSMGITVLGKQSAHTDVERASNVVKHLVGRCAHWPVCTMNQDVSIAAIPAGQTATLRVKFNNIPHLIVAAKHRPRMAIGPYICRNRPNSFYKITPGSASIIVFLRQADVDEAPSFRANNYLSLTGKFDSGLVCGMTNKIGVRRTGRKIRILP